MSYIVSIENEETEKYTAIQVDNLKDLYKKAISGKTVISELIERAEE
jgi:hypothetical protein